MKKLLIPIMVFLMLATGCFYLTDGAGPGGTAPMSTINSFDASPLSISPGGSSTLNWNVTGATSVAIDQGVGNVALTGSRMVTPSATTIYTLTATNAGGTITATTQVIVEAVAPPPPPTPTPPPPPTPTPADLPIISYFSAVPPAIIAGDTSTLSWSVSNAVSVTIDQGVGNVGLVGTAPVSPASTINYTLTATNAAGWSSVTIPVIVSAAPPPAGKPDLVITTFSRSGGTINYTIKNQGTEAAATTTSSLTIDGGVKAYDPVPPLAAGASSTRSFATYSYSCTGTSDTIKVKADANNAVSESIEGNNEYAKSYMCITITPDTKL